MGSPQSTTTNPYRAVNTTARFTVLNRQDAHERKYALKTVHSQSTEQHIKLLTYFKQYQLRMEGTQ